MTGKMKTAGQQTDNTAKDSADWKRGDEPGAQRSYLHTPASKVGKEVDDNLTKAEAAQRIEAIQRITGRGHS